MRILTLVIICLFATDVYGWSLSSHVYMCDMAGYSEPERCTDLDRVRTVTSLDKGKKVPTKYVISKELEDSIRSVPYYANTYAWHWMNIPSENGSFEKFVSDIFQKYDDPREGFETTGASLVAIKYLLEEYACLSDQERYFLMHLLGDVTQPMHNHVYDTYNKRVHRASDHVSIDLSTCEYEEVVDVFSYAKESARLGWEYVRFNDVEDFTSSEVEVFFSSQACRSVNMIRSVSDW